MMTTTMMMIFVIGDAAVASLVDDHGPCPCPFCSHILTWLVVAVVENHSSSSPLSLL